MVARLRVVDDDTVAVPDPGPAQADVHHVPPPSPLPADALELDPVTDPYRLVGDQR